MRNMKLGTLAVQLSLVILAGVGCAWLGFAPSMTLGSIFVSVWFFVLGWMLKTYTDWVSAQ
jgi:hypothetical protein